MVTTIRVFRSQTQHSAKLTKNAKPVVYKGAPHGLCTEMKDTVNAELHAFIQS